MTVKQDLERAIAMAQASRGNYLLFATESEDQTAKDVFVDMADDMDRHVKILESRRDYLDQHNPLNAGGQDDQTGQNGKNGKNGKNGQDGKQ